MVSGVNFMTDSHPTDGLIISCVPLVRCRTTKMQGWTGGSPSGKRGELDKASPLTLSLYFCGLTECLCSVFAVSNARLTSQGGLFTSKADPYLELSVDGQPPRKTEVIKKTWNPTWNDHFTV
jgi:hypothetical protein